MRFKINWQLRSKIIEKYLFLRYYKWWPSSKKTNLVIIIMFNNKIKHGGLLDRLKGIISAKMIAEKTGLPFGIFSDNNSFNLFKYLLIKEPQMLFSREQLCMTVYSSTPVVMYNTLSFSEQDILSRFQNKNKSYHYYTNLDFSIALYPQMNKDELNELWKKKFNELFSFADNIILPAQKILNSIKTCGIHLRFTSILGDFDEAVNKPLPGDQKQMLIVTCTEVVLKIIHDENFQQFLIVSDSVTFLNHIRQVSFNSFAGKKIIILPGNIGHVDVNHGDEVLEKSVLDFYLLSQCRKIIQVKAKQMYNSQYSRYAAIVGESEYVLYKI